MHPIQLLGIVTSFVLNATLEVRGDSPFVQNVPLHSTHSSDCLSPSVSNLMRRRLIHVLPLAYVARRSPLIYPANRTLSDGRPRRIWCYKMCSIDSGLWCWDAPTQAARDDAQSQCRGWRGVLSFCFEVRMRQGRVTLHCKSCRGVRAPHRQVSAHAFIP